MIVDPPMQLSSDQQAELANLAATTGKPWTVVLNEALATYRRVGGDKQNGDSAAESFFEVATRRGFVGCLQGGPADLSTNPAYLEGFGQSNG